MTRGEFNSLLEVIQEKEREVREAGQKEYAHQETNAFANFERIGDKLGLAREMVALVFALKHLDGVVAHIVHGHTSQREDVRGRLKDLRMYMALLWGMVDENEKGEESETEVEEEENAVFEPSYSPAPTDAPVRPCVWHP